MFNFTVSTSFMLNFDEKGTNLSFSIHIMLYKRVFLFSKALAEKIKKSLVVVLMEKKAMGTQFGEEKRCYEAPMARKASLKGQKEYMVGRAT